MYPSDIPNKVYSTSYTIYRYRWFCIGDDDTYILVPNLVKTLRRYGFNKDWYIGRNSIDHKLKRTLRDGKVNLSAE